MPGEVRGQRSGGGPRRGVLPEPLDRGEHAQLPAPARTGEHVRADEAELRQRAEVRRERCDLLLAPKRDEDVLGAVVVQLERQLRTVHAQRREQLAPSGERVHRRHGLDHAPEDDPPRLVALEPHGHGAGAGLERDRAELERRPEHERGAERRVPGERELARGREDADPDVPTGPGRQNEDRLREAELERERLHRRLVQIACVREHRQLVARQRHVGEDVREHVAKRAHRPSLDVQRRCKSCVRSPCSQVGPELARQIRHKGGTSAWNVPSANRGRSSRRSQP